MGVYALQNLGDTLSQIVTADDAQDEAIRSFERGATAPSVKPTGLLHNTTGGSVLSGLSSGLTEAMARWNGVAWTLFCDPTKAQVNAGGTVPFAAAQSMGGHKLTGLAAATADGDAVRYEQVLLVAGGTMAGDLDMDGNQIVGLPTPTADDEPATKEYVDDGLAAAAPVFGTVAVSTATPEDVALGFMPSFVRVRAYSSTQTTAEVGMVLAGVAVTRVAPILSNSSSSVASGSITVEPSSSSPNGFKVTAPLNGTVVYEAWR